MSTLSQSLYQFANPKLKYFKDANVAHIPDVYPMDINFGGIYSPNVCFFRNNLSEHYSLKEKPFVCSIVTVASLSNRETNDYTNDESMYFDNNGYLTSEGKEIEKNKIRTIYRIALDNNHDSIVLGAFGCGVNRLHPEEVSKLFKEIVEEETEPQVVSICPILTKSGYQCKPTIEELSEYIEEGEFSKVPTVNLVGVDNVNIDTVSEIKLTVTKDIPTNGDEVQEEVPQQ